MLQQFLHFCFSNIFRIEFLRKSNKIFKQEHVDELEDDDFPDDEQAVAAYEKYEDSDGYIANITCRIHESIPYGKMSSGFKMMVEIDRFVSEGYCKDERNAKFHRCNPTLMTPERKRWQVHCLSNPFDSYFPIPDSLNEPKEKILSDIASGKKTLYNYCLTEMERRVKELRSRKNVIVFNFHSSDYTELKNDEKMKTKFQVVYSWELAERVGLANLIPATIDCLADDDPNAVLVTGTYSWGLPTTSAVAEYVKSSLSCPLSLLPTVFGVKLTNEPEQLSSPVCVKGGHHAYKDHVNLTWVKALPYSSNVKLAISPDLKSAIDLLKTGKHLDVLQSMVKRNNWIEGVTQDVVPTEGDVDFPVSLANETGGKFFIRSCMESEKEYELVFSFNGIKLEDANG